MVFFKAAEIIKSLKEKIGLKEEYLEIDDIWEKVLGKMATHTEIVGIKEDKLIVEVDSSVYYNELFMLKKEIVEKINKKLKKTKIKDIKFKI